MDQKEVSKVKKGLNLHLTKKENLKIRKNFLKKRTLESLISKIKKRNLVTQTTLNILTKNQINLLKIQIKKILL